MSHQPVKSNYVARRLRNVSVWTSLALSIALNQQAVAQPDPVTSSSSGPVEERIFNPAKAAPGTYEFIFYGQDNQEIFTDDILVVIEQLRKDDETVVHRISENVHVKIISRRELNQRGNGELSGNSEKGRYEK